MEKKYESCRERKSELNPWNKKSNNIVSYLRFKFGSLTLAKNGYGLKGKG